MLIILKARIQYFLFKSSVVSNVIRYQTIFFFSIPPLPSGGTPDSGPCSPLPRQELQPVAANLCADPDTNGLCAKGEQGIYEGKVRPQVTPPLFSILC